MHREASNRGKGDVLLHGDRPVGRLGDGVLKPRVNITRGQIPPMKPTPHAVPPHHRPAYSALHIFTWYRVSGTWGHGDMGIGRGANNMLNALLVLLVLTLQRPSQHRSATQPPTRTGHGVHFFGCVAALFPPPPPKARSLSTNTTGNFSPCRPLPVLYLRWASGAVGRLTEPGLRRRAPAGT